MPHHGPSPPSPAVSRSSLNRGFYAPDVPLNIVPEVPLDRQERAFEQYGNTSTYNLENVLRQNILTSTYYQKTAVPIEQWQDLVDEIYYRCGSHGVPAMLACRGSRVLVFMPSDDHVCHPGPAPQAPTGAPSPSTPAAWTMWSPG